MNDVAPNVAKVLLMVTGLLMLAGCGDPGTGPRQVHWDHASCDRCRMVVSNRAYAAQIRSFRPNGDPSLNVFDDIGCAVIWLDRKPWREDPGTEFWVTDWRNGTWIDARTAYYVTSKKTPMGYGLGAQSVPERGALDYAAARKHVYEVEESFNAPVAEPEDSPTGTNQAPHPVSLPPVGVAPSV